MCIGHIDRKHFAIAKEANLRNQSDGARNGSAQARGFTFLVRMWQTVTSR